MGFGARLMKARKLMHTNRLDSLLLSSREDIFYYTGYKAAEGNILIIQNSGKPSLLVSPLENDAERVRTAELVYWRKIEDITKQMKNKTVGFDELSLSSSRFLNLHRHHIRLKKASSLIKKPREIKEESEIDDIKKAISITKKVLENTDFYNKREADAASRIEAGFMLNCADKAFDTIVANGTASIHHIPDNTVIRSNKPTIFDLGARYNWYCCDVSRTYLGKSGIFWNKIWEDVSEMQKEIIDNIEPGITMKGLEDLHENLKKKKKYKVHHSFGHGVGLDVHEQITDSLKENMIITVEPGVYLKHKGAVRIEDTILVKKNKPLILSSSIEY